MPRRSPLRRHPCAGIVDIDVLNDTSEFDKQLEVIAPSKADTDKAQQLREDIATSLGEVQPNERLSILRSCVREIEDLISGENVVDRAAANRLLRQVEESFTRQLISESRGVRSRERAGPRSVPKSGPHSIRYRIFALETGSLSILQGNWSRC